MTRRGRASAGVAAGVAITLVASLAPFVWMALSSITSTRELYRVPPHWLPHAPTLEHYRTVLWASNIPRYFLNSAIISVGSTAVALVLAIFAAYGLARFRFRGRRAAPCCQPSP